MNILPPTQKEDLKLGYKRRLLVVCSYMVSISFLVGATLLVPSYFLMESHISVINEESKIQPADDSLDAELLKLPGEIENKLRVLQANATNTKAIEAISKVISFLPDNTSITSFYFSREKAPTKKGNIKMVVSGTAADRIALSSFSSSLQNSKQFLTVEVPVSNLTKDKDLPFSMNINIEN